MNKRKKTKTNSSIQTRVARRQGEARTDKGVKYMVTKETRLSVLSMQ